MGEAHTVRGYNYGQDTSNELQNKIPVMLTKPVHTLEVLARHAIQEQMVCIRQQNLQQAHLSKRAILEAAAALGVDPDAPMQLAILDNEVAEGDYRQNNEVPIKLLDSEKTQYNNDWRTYQERNALLTKNRGQAFSLILGQCNQLLHDRMKQDTNWNTASTSYNPLDLYQLLQKTMLAQMEDQNPFATVYNQELSFYSFWQETMSNLEWYEKFNTKVDVGSAIGVTQQHKVLLEYVAQENHMLAFTALSAEQKQAVHEDTEECYISYAFLRQRGAQHGNLKVDLRNNFTTGSNRYPKTHQQTLHLLDKYSKTVVVPKMTPSEGSSFAQKGGRGGRGGKDQGSITFDKEYWKDKTCFTCSVKGHPSSSCMKTAVGKDDDSQRQHCA
jgi:hypothetical protein